MDPSIVNKLFYKKRYRPARVPACTRILYLYLFIIKSCILSFFIRAGTRTARVKK